MSEMAGKKGERRLSKIGMEQMLVSMGYQTCGALTLWNYPSWLRNLVAHDINGEERPELVDMASMESKFFTLKNLFLSFYYCLSLNIGVFLIVQI